MVVDGQSKCMVKIIYCEGDGGLPIIYSGKNSVGHGVVIAGVVEFAHMFEIEMRRGVTESVAKGAGYKKCHEIFIGAVFEASGDGSGKADIVGSNNNGSG